MEFILRQVSKKDGVEHNSILGYHYSYYNRRVAPTMIEGLWKNKGNELPIPKDLFGIIISEDGNTYDYLYSSSDYFIMTATGTTFERIKP